MPIIRWVEEFCNIVNMITINNNTTVIGLTISSKMNSTFPYQIRKLTNFRQKNGFQGVFISPDSEERLLMLESLAIKIYETDTTKILRSLAHGIDACASYEGVNSYCFLSRHICKYCFVFAFTQSQSVLNGRL